LDGNACYGDRTAAAVTQPKAELDVRVPVEAELGIEAADRLRILAPEGHAVGFDGVDLGAGTCLELLQSALATQSVRAGQDDRWIGKRLDERRDRIAFQLHSWIEQDYHFARGRVDACIDR